MKTYIICISIHEQIHTMYKMYIQENVHSMYIYIHEKYMYIQSTCKFYMYVHVSHNILKLYQLHSSALECIRSFTCIHVHYNIHCRGYMLCFLPSCVQGPEVSLDDYTELFTATKRWVEDKTKEVKKRNFPNTVPEMKVSTCECVCVCVCVCVCLRTAHIICAITIHVLYVHAYMYMQAKIDFFNTYKSKELPVKHRDLASLKTMHEQLVKQAAKKKRGAAVPEEMTFELLEVEWAVLEKENKECEVAMEKELERFGKRINCYIMYICTYMWCS